MNVEKIFMNVQKPNILNIVLKDSNKMRALENIKHFSRAVNKRHEKGIHKEDKCLASLRTQCLITVNQDH